MFGQPIDNYLYNYMGNLLDDSNLFSSIYYLKKNMLMFENIHGESFMVAHKQNRPMPKNGDISIDNYENDGKTGPNI